MYKIEELKEYRGYYIDTNGIVYSSYIKGARGKRGTDIFPLKFSQDKGVLYYLLTETNFIKKFVG